MQENGVVSIPARRSLARPTLEAETDRIRARHIRTPPLTVRHSRCPVQRWFAPHQAVREPRFKLHE